MYWYYSLCLWQRASGPSTSCISPFSSATWGRMEGIDTGLQDLQEVIRDMTIRSLAIPPLGGGMGGLDWNDVQPWIEEALSGFI